MIIASSSSSKEKVVTKRMKKGICDAPLVVKSQNKNAVKDLNRIRSAFGRTNPILKDETDILPQSENKQKKEIKKQ